MNYAQNLEMDSMKDFVKKALFSLIVDLGF